MVGWHHWLYGHEFDQTLGVSDRQGTLLGCSEWGCKVRHNWVTELKWVPPIRKLPQATFPHPSEGRQNKNHSHRKLIKLNKWITALFNSMKLWVMVESSDKTWSTGQGNVKPLQLFCLENPVNGMKRQKEMTIKDELPRSVGAQYAPGEKWRNSSKRNKESDSNWKQCTSVDASGSESKVRCCKEQYCIGTWNVRSMNQGKLEVGKKEIIRVNIDMWRLVN